MLIVLMPMYLAYEISSCPSTLVAAFWSSLHKGTRCRHQQTLRYGSSVMSCEPYGGTRMAGNAQHEALVPKEGIRSCRGPLVGATRCCALCERSGPKT